MNLRGIDTGALADLVSWQINTLEAEKRRATEEAARATMQLKQEEQRNATEVENLQEQCQNLALQHAKSMARCEQLTKQVCPTTGERQLACRECF